MKVVIDRFEGDYAVCEKEDRTMMDVLRSSIPAQSKEGDVLNMEDGVITIDTEETDRRRKMIEELTKDIWG